jgi:hypothetical protein
VDYPVLVEIRIPETASAVKGSPELIKLEALQQQLTKTGWFVVDRKADGDYEKFRFRRNNGAPAFIRTTASGFSISAAQAEFVKALRTEYAQDQLKVTYQIRLINPTAQFTLFQTLHPNVKIGDTKERHALYKRDGHSWVLQETDETFKKTA